MISADIATSAEWLRARGFSSIDAAVILGSGLHSFPEEIAAGERISAREIPGYPVSTIPGHDGELALCTISDKRVLVFGGRVHVYEGYDAATTAASVALAHALGASLLVTTNAAGGVNPSFDAGDLMLITDFLVLPLAQRMGGTLQQVSRGSVPASRHITVLGEEQRRAVLACAAAAGVQLRAGTYGYASGPSYETRAEIAMLRRIGVDAIGMSTVPEILASISRGMRVVPVTCITNTALTVATVTTHSEVTRVAGLAGQRLGLLLREVLRRA